MPSVNQPLDGSEKFAGLIPLALVAPEASEAGGGVKFENFGTLTFRHRNPPRALPLRHRSYGLMCHSRWALFCFGIQPRLKSLGLRRARLFPAEERGPVGVLVAALGAGQIADGVQQIAPQPMHVSLSDPLVCLLDKLRSLGEAIESFSRATEHGVCSGKTARPICRFSGAPVERNSVIARMINVRASCSQQ
jgi:hypothetical protein